MKEPDAPTIAHHSVSDKALCSAIEVLQQHIDVLDIRSIDISSLLVNNILIFIYEKQKSFEFHP